MARSTPYWVCPHCGSNLDHGERCTCQDGKVKDAAPEVAREARNRREPVLAPGA